MRCAGNAFECRMSDTLARLRCLGGCLKLGSFRGIGRLDVGGWSVARSVSLLIGRIGKWLTWKIGRSGRLLSCRSRNNCF